MREPSEQSHKIAEQILHRRNAPPGVVLPEYDPGYTGEQARDYEELKQYFEDQGSSATTELMMLDLKADNPHIKRRFLMWVHTGESQSRSRTRLLRCMVEYGHGVEYETLTNEVGISKRRIRELFKPLQDDGLVEARGCPRVFSFVDDVTYLIATDIAAKL